MADMGSILLVSSWYWRVFDHEECCMNQAAVVIERFAKLILATCRSFLRRQTVLDFDAVLEQTLQVTAAWPS
jgi:hypothetical protein